MAVIAHIFITSATLPLYYCGCFYLSCVRVSCLVSCLVRLALRYSTRNSWLSGVTTRKRLWAWHTGRWSDLLYHPAKLKMNRKNDWSSCLSVCQSVYGTKYKCWISVSIQPVLVLAWLKINPSISHIGLSCSWANLESWSLAQCNWAKSWIQIRETSYAHPHTPTATLRVAS